MAIVDDSLAMARAAERGMPLADFECEHGRLSWLGEECLECESIRGENVE